MALPILQEYLALLGKRDLELALAGTSTLLAPPQYAVIVGQRQGLELARQLLEQLLNKEDTEESQR